MRNIYVERNIYMSPNEKLYIYIDYIKKIRKYIFGKLYQFKINFR
jgi:phosphoglucomutase